MTEPPLMYYSPAFLGQTMRLPIPEEPSYTVQAYPNPYIPTDKIYIYKYSHCDVNHPWTHKELRKDYRARLEKEWEERGKLNPSFHEWVMEHDGYPEMANTIITIKPAWVYRLIGEQ